MEETPAISVIIPVYESEPYLRECLDSLLLQDIKEPYEVILAVDPSEDDSLLIAESYAASHKEIKVLDQSGERLGIQKSRLHALSEASAPYVTFMDADDVMAPNGLRTALEAISGSGADVVNFSFYILSGKKARPFPFTHLWNRVYKGKRIMKALLFDASVRAFLWAKVFKRELLLNSDTIGLFDRKDMFEDVAYVFGILVSADKMVSTPKRYYFYRKGVEGSTTTVRRSDRAARHLTVFALERIYLEERKPEYLGAWRRKAWRAYMSLRYDLGRDKKAGATKDYVRRVKKEMRLLKKKAPLKREGVIWEGVDKRALG
jgi:glycosyltransferase involved in cell wall biosynthesis